MNTRIGLLLAVVVVGLTASATAQSTPPPIIVQYGATNARPVAGQPFTGLSIVPVGDTYISTISCNARLGRKLLRGRVLRYKWRGARPLSVTCGWSIPAGSHGKHLRISHEYIVTTAGQEREGPSFSWLVR